MRIAFTGVGGTGKTTLARHLSETRTLTLNPVGARGTAAAMGFTGKDGTGRPFDVDRALLGAYRYVLESGVDIEGNGKTVENAARSAKKVYEAYLPGKPGGPTCRPLFQERLQQDKIAWELEHDAFVTDRTPLDDVAYAMIHCPELVTRAFLDTAVRHLLVYDLIVFAPLSAGQWLGDDSAREGDAGYYWRLEVMIRGLFDLAWSEIGHLDVLPVSMMLSGGQLEWRKGLVERQIEGMEDAAREEEATASADRSADHPFAHLPLLRKALEEK